MESDTDHSLVGNREEWAARFDQQADQCASLGSDLWARLLRHLSTDIVEGGPTWSILVHRSDLRFGQAGPLRLLGGAHRLALAGKAPAWAALLPSCGGTVPSSDVDLAAAWGALTSDHADALLLALDKEVQTNEVARVGGLGLGLALTGFERAHLVEMGCSGALNLRLDQFRIDLTGTDGETTTLGRGDSVVAVNPEVDGTIPVSLRLPEVLSRTGIDPFPIDVTTADGRLTLLSFMWPDQVERFARLQAAIELAQEVPVDLVATKGTAEAITNSLNVAGPRVVLHSIVWQYLPTAERWAVTEALESAGATATTESPLAWIRFEPDEWDRRRAAVWLRTWPDGTDRLVAHSDFHGRWLTPR